MLAKVILARKAARRFGKGFIGSAAVFMVAYWLLGKLRR